MRRALILLGLPVGLVLGLWWLAGGFAGLLDWVAAAQRQTQDALGRLDAAVLRDIGVGASSFGPNRPVIEVEAGLMLILTGLR